jgi:23S rRNA pseudouridine1911/1915/1917 synthase
LNKPSGLLVHADGRSKEETLVDWIGTNYPDLKEVGETQILQNGEVIKRPGIVHRLDRDTSGVILVAKTEEAHRFLKEQFQNRKVEKIYNAVVWGKFSSEKIEGVIDKPIGRSASDFRKWSAEHGAKGELREAITEYKVLAQRSFDEVESDQKEIDGKSFAYLEVKPKTGRTHQIRVHMKSISHPVIMDKLYGNKDSFLESGILNFNRLALHALSIKLELPPARTDGSGGSTHIKIESPLPMEFETAKQCLSIFDL